MRVQIPVYTDFWMMGDRFGEVVKISKKAKRGAGEPGLPAYKPYVEIAHVKLDISGKTLRFLLDDCVEVA